MSLNRLFLLDFNVFPSSIGGMLRALLTLCLLLSPMPALAWGAQGHEIVAAIALRELTPAARQQVARLLGSETMLLHDSNWADEIREQNPETGPWHYVDIPLGAPGYDAARDCPGGACVVAQIGDDLKALRDWRQPEPARAQALKYLIHFVGDIHQPLHAVDNDDRGGNEVHVLMGRDRTNLHHIWDVELVQALGWDANAVAFDIESHITPAQKKAWCAGTPASWANESFHLASNEIYPLVNGRRALRLPAGYPDAEAPLVRMQLAKAGVRLAWLLNSALR